MKSAIERLSQAIAKKNSRVCVGLDPCIDVIPDAFLENAEKILTKHSIYFYCVQIIDAVKDIVPVVKPNIAFFESLGFTKVFFDVCKYAKQKGLIVIADVKRADIGNTSKQYANAFLGKDSPIDFITVNPYFGTDSLEPFIKLANDNDKGLFILAKTSNPSSTEIQDLILEDGTHVYDQVAKLIEKWGETTPHFPEHGYNCIGAVVGATHKDQAAALRKLIPNTWFLVPGHGVQGVTVEDVAVNFDVKGYGAIVNVSRSIIGAWKKPEHEFHSLGDSARIEAIRMREQINYALKIR